MREKTICRVCLLKMQKHYRGLLVLRSYTGVYSMSFDFWKTFWSRINRFTPHSPTVFIWYIAVSFINARHSEPLYFTCSSLLQVIILVIFNKFYFNSYSKPFFFRYKMFQTALYLCQGFLPAFSMIQKVSFSLLSRRFLPFVTLTVKWNCFLKKI